MTMVFSAAGDSGAPEVETACGGADTGGAEEMKVMGGVASLLSASSVLVKDWMGSPPPSAMVCCSVTTLSVMAANRGSVGAARLTSSRRPPPSRRPPAPPATPTGLASDTYAYTTTVSAAPAQVAWLRPAHTVALAHPLQRSAAVQFAESRA